MTDAQNERFEKWRSDVRSIKLDRTLESVLKEAFCDGWNAAIENTEEKRFGCHIAWRDKVAMNNCVMDPDYVGVGVCIEAHELIDQNKTKADCKYWREVKP